MPPKVVNRCLIPTRNGPCWRMEGHKTAHRSRQACERQYAAQGAKNLAWRAAHPEEAAELARGSARQWREVNREYDRERMAAYSVSRTRSVFRDRVQAYKLAQGCADCGYKDHAEALDLDHRDPELKVTGVAILVRSVTDWAVVEAELVKCDVVCANCHRVRTAQRRKGGKSNV